VISEDDLRMLVAMTVETLFGAPPDGWAPPGPLGEGYRAAVRISGESRAEVAVWCGAGFARRVAGAMFGFTEADLTEADLRDAVGELANILGGNLKALMPGPSSLSCPVVDPTASGSSLPGIRFAVDGQAFAVEVGAG
jgi:chemotaxis protein CheX